nr:hypothetical protein [Mammaliicoccus sp. Marseille-Q6498]
MGKSTKITGELVRFGEKRQKSQRNLCDLGRNAKNLGGTLALWDETTKFSVELWSYGVKRTISSRYGAILG